MIEGYVTIAQAARRCEAPEHAIRKMISSGALVATKVGTIWLIPTGEVERIQREATCAAH